MASVVFKNSPPGSRFRFETLQPEVVVFPSDSSAGIVAATSITQNVETSLTLATASSGLLLGQGVGTIFYCAGALAPDFTASLATATFDYVIEGWDHFGDFIVDRGSKTGTGNGIARSFRVFSAIKSIKVTRTDAGAAATVSVGVNHAAGGTQWVRPLPFKLPDASSIVRFQLLSAGAFTMSSWVVMESKKAIGGTDDIANANTALTANNTYGWTPNRLAREGLAVYTAALPTPAAGATPYGRWFFAPTVVGSV